jgi:HAD superfamily hydrolase (TIGR01490 family)
MTSFAFFDFDETVVTFKSMFKFLAYYLEQTDPLHATQRFEELLNHICLMIAEGHSREAVNRYYYSRFQGVPASLVALLGESFYREISVSKHPFWIEFSFQEIKKLQQEGCEVVFVSGSFEPVIKPFATALQIEKILCTRPIISNGIYTGTLEGNPVIGSEKARLIQEFLQSHNTPPTRCRAYGDHISDIPMLEVVGLATLVNPNLELLQLGQAKGWNCVKGG